MFVTSASGLVLVPHPRLSILIARFPDGAYTYGDDGEKFGVWPGTSDWVWTKGWLREFFRLLSERTDIVSIQDTLAQRGQGVIADRKNEHLGRSDVAVIEIRKVFMRELRALAEGHPVKQWSRAAGAAVEH